MPSSSAARRRVSPRSAPPEAPPLAVAIERIGHLGDGLGITEDGATVCVPGTLPGERVVAQPAGRRGGIVLARPLEWLTASPDRIAPPCPHFGPCGGCALQHWAPAQYVRWKTDLLLQALQRAGYADPPIRTLVPTGPHERRRIDLAFRRSGRSVALGLHQAGGEAVIDITGCVLLHPDIEVLLPPLRSLLARLPAAGTTGRVAINLTDGGADLLVRATGMPDTGERTLITAFARQQGVARVHWACGEGAAEAVCIHQPAVIRFASVRTAGIEVAIPPDAFLQASRSAEAAILALVVDGLIGLKHRKLLELYAGCGSLTFGLADLGSVTAYEGNAAAAAALRTAANRSLPGRITCQHRDLVRQPLMTRELAGFAAAVLDPPWVGAAVQIAEIAKSALDRVVYVSCNPSALQRDAETLRAGGFSISAATPVDQFLWSAQLESVVVFRR